MAASTEKKGKSNEMKMSLFSFIRRVRACDTVTLCEFECVRGDASEDNKRRHEQCVLYTDTNNTIEWREKRK